MKSSEQVDGIATVNARPHVLRGCARDVQESPYAELVGVQYMDARALVLGPMDGHGVHGTSEQPVTADTVAERRIDGRLYAATRAGVSAWSASSKASRAPASDACVVARALDDCAMRCDL